MDVFSGSHYVARSTVKMDSAEKKLIVIEATKKKILRSLAIFWLVAFVLLLLRIILMGAGANPQSLFAGLIYFLSGILLLPFFGIFPQNNTSGPTFDSAAFIAIFSYSILVLLTIGVTLIVTRMKKTGKQVEEQIEKDHPVDPTESSQIVQ